MVLSAGIDELIRFDSGDGVGHITAAPQFL